MAVADGGGLAAVNHDAVLGCLRRAGFPVALASGLGLAVEDCPHPRRDDDRAGDGGTYDYADEFDYGLDLVLDGLEERLARAPAADG